MAAMCKQLSVFIVLFVVFSGIDIRQHRVRGATVQPIKPIARIDRPNFISLADEARTTWHTCCRNFSTPLWNCLRNGSLDIFDRMTGDRVIPLTDTIRLVRSHALKPHFISHKRSTRHSWSEHILHRFATVLSTHILQFDLLDPDEMGTGRRYGSNRNGAARHRHRNQMLPMMIFGVTALGVFVVPMGFQMLAILSGKALLMAKMALLLASMNGLKRVANSGLHYGVYHSDPIPHHHHAHSTSYWDRQDGGQQQHNQPRSNEVSQMQNNPLVWG